MLYNCLLFVLLFSATINESVSAKIIYNEFSNNERENNFEGLAANAEENLIDDAMQSRRENFEAGENDPEKNSFENENYMQNEGDENSIALKSDSELLGKDTDNSLSRKVFAADEENSESMDNSDEAYVFDKDADFEEQQAQKQRFSSDKKITRSDHNDKSAYAVTSKDSSKQSSQLHKRKICDKGRVKNEKSGGIYGKDMKRKTYAGENDCPTRTFQSNSNHAGLQKKSFVENKQDKFKRNRNWSEDQLNALSFSLSKIRDDSSEFENLKNILYDMGLANNMPVKKRYSEGGRNEYLENENFKRDADENEDEDMTKNDIILRKNEATSGNSKRETNREDEINKRETMEKSNNQHEQDLSNNLEHNSKMIHKRSNEYAKNDIGSRNTREGHCNTDLKSDLSKGIANEEDKFDENEESIKEDIHRTKRNDTNKSNVYQKRMEDQIQAKIDSIKEKVKRELKRQEQVKKDADERKKKEVPKDENNGKLIRRRSYSRKSKLNKKSIGNDANKSKNIHQPLYQDQIRKKRANRVSDDNYRQYEDQESNENFIESRNENLLDKRLADDYQYEPNKRESEDYIEPNQEMYRSKKQKYSDDTYEKDDSQEEQISPENRAAYLNNYEVRKKRRDTGENQKSENNNAAENEYFGALPESYDGESNRRKRVRRDRLEDAPNNE